MRKHIDKLKANAHLRKAVIVVGLIAALEAFLIPSLGGNASPGPFWDENGREKLAHVVSVIRENRTGLASAEEKRLAEVIVGEALAYEIDPLLVLALIKTESTFYNWSRSMKGALGLMQLMPSTGRAIAEEMRLDWKGEDTLLDPIANVKMGVYYFSMLGRKYSDQRMALAAYNAGPTLITSKIRLGEEISPYYADKVLAAYDDMRQRAYYLQ